MAVLFLDLDDFKEINDRFGHAVGDRALQMAAGCMTAAVRATDTVSRYGGDEFLIVLGEIAHAVDASLIAEKLNVALREHGSVDDHRVRLSASIGISVYPEDGDDAQVLIDRADAAMYWAKKELLGGFAFHADRSPDGPGPSAPSEPSASRRKTPHELSVVEHERRHAQLREANEELVLAALGAQELLRAAEEARRRRSALLDAVAQELRNPYAPIRIAAAVLGRPEAHDDLLGRAQVIIAQQMDQMSLKVAGLLEPETSTGEPTDTRAVFDVCALATEAVQRCQPVIDAHSQTIDVHIPPTPIGMSGNPVQIAQILSTLLNNATTYSRPGGRILLSIERVGEAAVLTVGDNGAGIAPDALATLLDPFVRDPRSVASGEEGLGLTVVRAIVEAHGGSVVAASGGLGQGSQFTLALPTAAH